MAAGSTYTPIATTTASGSTNSITFSSISSSYTDLIIVVGGQQASPASAYVRFNSDTGTNYSFTRLSGNGSTAASERNTNMTSATCGVLYAEQYTWIIQIMNYSNTTTYKTLLSRSNSANNVVTAYASLWRSTSAINSVTVLADTNFNSGTVLSLYGILAA